MSSVLHFSPAFKHYLSLSDLPSSSSSSFSPAHKSSKKRKRGLDPSDDDVSDGDRDGLEADSAAKGTSLPSRYSNAIVITSAATLNVDIPLGEDTLRSQTISHNDHGGPHTSYFPPSFPHQTAETAPSMSKGRISDELASLKPPLFVATGSLPAATAQKSSSSTGLRQHHLDTITAILHRCLSEGDYIRAGRAWGMLLRAEQNGNSIDLRTYDRWGVGAEILMKRELQMVRRTTDHNVVEVSNSTSNLRVKAESMEKAKEYFERLVLQFPYRKAFPNATEPLDFSIAMFSLWIYTVKERTSTALMAVCSSDNDIEETDAEANDAAQRSSVSDMETDRDRKREQVTRDTLQISYEIADRLDGLLASPPYSDEARFWKLCGEMYLWIADLLVAIVPNYGSSSGGDEEDLTAGSSSLLKTISRGTSSNEEHKAGQERQRALAKSKIAFQRARTCGESSAK